MKKAASVALLAAVIILAFIIGFRSGRGGRSGAGSSESAAAQEAGAVDREANDADDRTGDGSEGAEGRPGSVSIDPRQRRLIGIRVGVVERSPFSHTLRVLGRVAVDDTRLYIINAATSGWVMDIEPATPGSLVRKGEVLASFYAPELLGAQQAFLYGLNTVDRLKEQATTPAPQLDSSEVSVVQYRDQLTNLGMGRTQIDEIARTRERAQQVRMVSPTTGIIVYRNIFPGLKFVQGQEFFRIADLSRVWILADVFEGEDRFLRPGLKAGVTLTGRNLSFEATVSRILPLFDPESRTLKVRLEAPNPDYALRPDMFVDVEIPIEYPPAIFVPADAVLDSGLRKTVFVERGRGLFEPREVETGWRLGGRVEITAGLEPGEKIALSGTFLIDSESRMSQPDLERAPEKGAARSGSPSELEKR